MGKKKSFVFYYDWRDILEPFDDVRLARLIRSILKYAVEGEDTVFDDLALTVSYNFIKNTMERDKVKYDEMCEKRAEIRRNAILKNKSQQLLTDVNDNDTDNVNDNDNDTDTVNDTEINISSFSSKTACEYSEDFLEFWKEYPKKVGKGEAFKKWKKERISGAELSDILNALKWQKSTDVWRKNGGQYIPNPSTYISQRRWEDEPLTISTDITDPTRYNDGDQLPDFILRGDF